MLSTGALAPGWDPPVTAFVPDGLRQGWDPRIVTSLEGGAIVAWREPARDASTDGSLWATRLMGNGSRATGWSESGVTLSQAPGEKNSIAAVSDGQGGAYISWSNSGANDDIMIQHVGVSGAILSSGSANGAIVCSAPGTRGESVCAPDGAQGALVAWADARGSSGRDIYVQRVTPHGAVATLLAIVDTDITADHVRLRWHAAALAGMPVVVERRAGALAWEPLEEARRCRWFDRVRGSRDCPGRRLRLSRELD